MILSLSLMIFLDQTYYPIALNDRAANSVYPFPKNVTKTSKYTAWNFVFKNLYEQYHRLVNVFFLICVIIAIIPPISPISPTTSILPTVFILVVTAIREGIEDIRRHKADNRVNEETFTILTKDGIVEVERYLLIVIFFILLVKSLLLVIYSI